MKNNTIKDIWGKWLAKRQEKLKYDFLPEAVEIVEKPTSPMGALVIGTVALMVVFFAGWAILGRMDEVVSARGRIVNVTGIQIVQTSNGGVIDEICVKEGEHIEAGQRMVILDASAYEITMQNTSRNIELLEYENELMQRLLSGEDIDETETGDGEKAEIQRYVLFLKNEYVSQKNSLLSDRKMAEEQILQQKNTLDSLKKQKENLIKQQEVLQEISDGENTAEKNAEKIAVEIRQQKAKIEDAKALYAVGAIAKSELKELQDRLKILEKEYEVQQQSAVYEDYDNSLRMMQAEGQLQALDDEYMNQTGAVAIGEDQKEQVLEQLNTLKAGFEEKLSGIIVENQTIINQQKTEQEIQNMDIVRQTVIAPVSGTIKTLDVTTEGGVLNPSQQIATIVPDDGQMIAELEVLNQDIGYVENGQNATMKLDTYNFQKYGKVNGIVVNVSPDALWNDQKGWVYVVKIAIDSQEFSGKNHGAQPGIGMEGTAEVKVTDRRIIDFFLEPVTEHFDGSLKIR